MIVSNAAIKLVSCVEEDCAAFVELRLQAMRPLGLYAGLGWNEADERRRHVKRFKKGGMFRIMVGSECAGFVGKQEKNGAVELDQACLYRRFRNRRVGSKFLSILLKEHCAGRVVTASALAKTASRKNLLRRNGFYPVRIGKDGKLIHYRRMRHGKKPAL